MSEVVLPIEWNFITDFIDLKYSKYLICIIQNKTQD